MEKLKKWMNENNIDLKKLNELLGNDESYFVTFKNKNRYWKFEELKKLSSISGISVYDLSRELKSRTYLLLEKNDDYAYIPKYIISSKQADDIAKKMGYSSVHAYLNSTNIKLIKGKYEMIENFDSD